MQTTRDPAVFAIGDCAACPRPGSPTPVPPRAQAAHQEASHMVRQIERRLRGQKLLPYKYRDFGSLVSLGKWSTVGNLMGFLFGRSFFVEGLFAQIMYRSLRIMHDQALGGTTRAVLGVVVRTLARRTGPQGEVALMVARCLPFVLSVIAGATDIIGVLGLNGLFTAHITGNLVVLAARIVADISAPVSYILSVPVFMLVLLVSGVIGRTIERSGGSSLQPLLLLQLLALVAFFSLSITAGPWRDPDTVLAIIAGMCGVAAMAVQNTLTQIVVEEYADHRGDDDKHHATDARFRHGAGRWGCGGRRQSKEPRVGHFAGGDRFLPSAALLARQVKPRSACGPSCCRRPSRCSLRHRNGARPRCPPGWR